MDVEVSERKLKVTYEYFNFIDQCQGGTVEVYYTDLCNYGRLFKNLFPLCDHFCLTKHEDLECHAKYIREADTEKCRCNENCLPVDVKCENNIQLIYNKTICSETYSNTEIWLGRKIQESVIGSYNPVLNASSYVEVQCAEFKTINPGQMSCSTREIIFKEQLLCAYPCRRFPREVICVDTRGVDYLDSRTCSCLNTCQPVTFTCDVNGQWSDFILPCSNQYSSWNHTMPNGENVIVGYNSLETLHKGGTLNVTCSSGFETKTNGIFPCINGILKTLHLPVCEKNYFTSSLGINSIYSPLLYILIFVGICIVVIAIIVYIIVKKIKRKRNISEDDDNVIYDEIDMRLAVPVAPPPPPEIPPRVRDAFGYLIVKKPYHYDVVGDDKPLEPWIKPLLDIDVEEDTDVGEKQSNVVAEVNNVTEETMNVNEEKNKVDAEGDKAVAETNKVDSEENKNKEDLEENNEDSEENKEDAVENKVDAVENKVGSEENKEDAKENKVDSEENKEDAEENKEDAEENKEDSEDNKEDAEENKVDSEENKEDAVENKEDLEENKVDPVEKELDAEGNNVDEVKNIVDTVENNDDEAKNGVCTVVNNVDKGKKMRSKRHPKMLQRLFCKT